MPTAEEKRAMGLLRKCEVLADASLEVIAQLLRGAKLGSFRPRQVVYLPGDRAQGVFFVAQGRVKIAKGTRDGKELTLAYRAGSDFFGEPCLLDGGPREEMAEAMDATLAVEVDREVLDDVLRSSGQTAYRFTRAL